MILNLFIESSAENDMLNIAEYIALDNKTAAANLLKTFYKSFEKLCSHPHLGTSRPDLTYREVKFFVIKKHYLIIYTVSDNELHILRVLSAYQDICLIL